MLINPKNLRRKYGSHPGRLTLTLSSELLILLRKRLRIERSTGELSNLVEQAVRLFLALTDTRRNERAQMEALTECALMLSQSVILSLPKDDARRRVILAALAHNLADVAEKLSE